MQNPEEDIKFLRRTYRGLRGRDARILREDFCGTFANSVHWVETDAKATAFAIDLDPEPLAWGKQNNLSKIPREEQQRVRILQRSVLSPKLPSADVVCALNFSYYTFKERPLLRSYLAGVLKQLNPKGILVLDSLGGTDCQTPCHETRKYSAFTYKWELESYNPIANHGKFAIHFKPKFRPILRRAFSYDWRIWSIVEIRELMKEVGFKRTIVYWEGTNRSGGGNGKFYKTETGEPCGTWIAYIVGIK